MSPLDPELDGGIKIIILIGKNKERNKSDFGRTLY